MEGPRYHPLNPCNAQLHGEFNYNYTPLAPPSTKIISDEKPTVRKFWAVHGLKVWYLSPSKEHYMCHCVYITKTRGESDSDCVDIFPHNNPLPYNSSSVNITIVAHELSHALHNPAPKYQFLVLETPKW